MTARLLLVEDEPDIRLIARAALMRSGFDVIGAESGEEALALVARERPDLILLDWRLPGLDGFETCARLKADSATQGIPVIFLTAGATAATEARADAVGALGCIAKPFNPLTLGERVRALWTEAGDRRGAERTE